MTPLFVSKSESPGGPYGPGTRENPVNLSDAPTEASHTAMRPEGMEPIDEAAMLSHFSDALSEMAESLMDLEDGPLGGDYRNREGPMGHFPY